MFRNAGKLSKRLLTGMLKRQLERQRAAPPVADLGGFPPQPDQVVIQTRSDSSGASGRGTAESRAQLLAAYGLSEEALRAMRDAVARDRARRRARQDPDAGSWSDSECGELW